LTIEGELRGDARAWTHFWQSGISEDIFAGSRTNLEKFWFGFFLALPRGGRLLDLGTGGGHVARLALRAGDGMRLGLDVVGVDYADIAPERWARATPQHCALTLEGNVRIEALPLADASFDAVVSQFGIEYAARKDAAREIARVLKPGGRGLFVLHHAQSTMTAATTARLKARREVLGDEPFAPARRLFESHAEGAAMVEADAALGDAIASARARMGSGFQYENVDQTIRFLEALAEQSGRYDPSDALAKIDAAMADSAAWEARQRAQTLAALDDAGIAAWIDEFARNGIEAEPPLVIGNERRQAMGWRLAIRKA
jgi:SAM-dependent methyltransferase